MAYSKDICTCITRFLDSDDWKYNLLEDKEIITMGVSLDSKMQHADIMIDLREDKYFVYCICPMKVGEAEQPEMAKLLNLINYGLMFGNFEMSVETGSLRFRYGVDCKGVLPSQEIVRGSILRPAITMDNYGDAIMQILMGFGTAEDAYQKAEEKD